MIKSFKSQATEDIFNGINSREARKVPHDLHAVAARKLDMIDAAVSLNDLLLPPGNRLEALRADLAGKHSIRINNQWRIIFRWSEEGAEELEIVDYH